MPSKCSTLATINQLLEFTGIIGALQNSGPFSHVLLQSRIPLQIGRAETRASKTHGTGLFATTEIEQGAVITLYPADVVFERMGDDTAASASAQLVQLCGTKNELKNAIEKTQIFKVDINKTLGIAAHPGLTSAPYLGHMINDAAMLSSSDEHSRQAYIDESTSKQNCCLHVCGENTHVVVRATRKIRCDEELFMSYGVPFWLSNV